MIGVEDFEMPTKHPWSMLSVPDPFEKESLLAWMLSCCIKANDLRTIIRTSREHPSMVEFDLLVKHDDKAYSLTTKSIGLLYSVYGKEQTTEAVQP